MSMLEVYDMVKELGYNSPQEIYWQSPGGVLSDNPLKTDSDVLSMLATMPKNKYAHVYLQEILDEQLPDSNAEIIRDAEISEHVETVRNVETELPIDAETVRNVETELPIDAETVRNTESEQSESEDEDTDYVGSESEQSDSPFEDSDNDLVCDVQVGVGRDIPGFRTCSSEDSDEGVDSEAETESLHSACDSETKVERNRFPEFNSVVDIENPKFKKGLLFSDQKIFKAAVKQYAVKNRFNIRLKVNDSARVQAVCKDGPLPRMAYGSSWIDANDCIYPLAFAIVESETRDSWTWFLQILETDLELTNSFHYTFMLDKQKGLIDSILELFPNSNSRTCVRHLYNNFKLQSGNQGKALKDALWRAARATYMKEWIDAMHELKAMSEQSFNWLVAKDPRIWSKAHFSTNLKSDMLLNNLCESFNKMILESRDKPIITMMEMIRCKIMTRIAAKKEAAEKIIGTLCPKIQKKLDKILEQSIRCWPRNACGQRWEVSAGFEDQLVMTCSKCGSKGHNKRSFRGQVGGNARAGRNARPSMSNTSEPMPTTHASQSSTMPTARATTSKLSQWKDLQASPPAVDLVNGRYAYILFNVCFVSERMWASLFC
ncbi:hypothetical protein GQ457_10G004540 [Hibiscus cannabinus]